MSKLDDVRRLLVLAFAGPAITDFERLVREDERRRFKTDLSKLGADLKAEGHELMAAGVSAAWLKVAPPKRAKKASR